MSAATVAPAQAHARRRIGLSVKFALAFLGLVSLVLIVNGGVNLWLSYDEAKHAALTVQQEKADAAAARINQYISEIESQIGWTTRTEWRSIGIEQQRYDFIRLLRQAPAITELQFLDGNGKEQLKVSRLEPDVVASLKDYSAKPQFAKAIADHLWFGPVYFRAGSEPYMTIAIAHAGQGAGVTVAEVNLKPLSSLLDSTQIGKEYEAYVVGPTGQLLAHSNPERRPGIDLSELPQVAAAIKNREPLTGPPR
jgi:hypothetical protein